MNLKLLSLATASIGVASATSNNNNLRQQSDHDHRNLQGSIACIVGGQKTVPECCAEASTDDAVCTLLTCVDLANVSVRDTCSCSMINAGCNGVAMFTGMVPGLLEMCNQADTCCGSDAAASNTVFNACMGKAVADGDVTLPDFSAIIPGGIPDMSGLTGTTSTAAAVPATLPEVDPVPPQTAATDAAVAVTLPAVGGDGTSATNIAVDVTEAPTDADTTGSTVVPGPAELATTVAPETTVAATPEATTTVAPGEPDPSPGSKYGVNEASMVVGTLLAMVFI